MFLKIAMARRKLSIRDLFANNKRVRLLVTPRVTLWKHILVQLKWGGYPRVRLHHAPQAKYALFSHPLTRAWVYTYTNTHLSFSEHAA